MKNQPSKSKNFPPFALKAPAKINLGLKITGKRPNGYHELQSLMCPLSFGDVLDFEPLKEKGAWSASSNVVDIPTGEGSLIEKAFRWASSALNYEGGLKVKLNKVIPTGAGLGGGSSDAAAVMRAVEKITGMSLLDESYPEIALSVGADVPFFLKEGAKWITGIGEIVSQSVRVPALEVLLIHPGIGISTKWVYSELKIEALTSKNPAVTLPPAFESFGYLKSYLTNDLESVVLPHYPVVREMKESLAALGADAALMSGSGSTVFGLYSDPKMRDEALKILKERNPQWWFCSCAIE